MSAMKIVSLVFSGLITISVWASFFVLIQEPTPTFESNDLQGVSRLGFELHSSLHRLEQASTEQTEVPEDSPTTISNDDDKPSLEEMASSNQNQEILYEFERSNPVSVDDLLAALGIQLQ